MKKIISFIISASIVLQIVAPGAAMLTYAQAVKNLYGFTWEDNRRLDDNLEIKEAREQSTEALLSWKVDENLNQYVLEYFIEDERDSTTILERIKVTFQRQKANKTEAKVTLEVLDAITGEAKKKDYYEYDFGSINPDGPTQHEDQESLTITITDGTRYPGGRISIDNLELRFRWKDGNVHFQTDYIQHGNITPFKLTYAGNSAAAQTIDVLKGLDGYTVSPVHIELEKPGDPDSKIINEETIKIPEGKNQPGSKPGIRLDFKRPRRWTGSQFQTLSNDEAAKINTTLVLEDLTDTASYQLKFNLGKDPKIEGLKGKEIIYDDASQIYSLYLAANDENHNNIIKWEKLKESMVMKTVQLSLSEEKTPGVEQALGNFSHNAEEGGRHTYLGYTIRRSSVEEAFLEIQPHNGAKNTEYKYFVQYSNDPTNWEDLVEHTYVTTGEPAEKPFTISVPFSSNFENQYYKITARYSDAIMSSQILHYQPDKDLSVPPPTPIIRSIDNIYAVPPIKLGDQPETIGFDLTWSAPKNGLKNKILDDLLKRGNIYYELFFHENLESTQDGGTLSKIFKVSSDDQGEVQVEAFGGRAGTQSSPKLRYNASKETFSMESIVIKNPNKNRWEQIEIQNDQENKDYDKGSQYPTFKVTDNMPHQEVPGIYYFTMRALYETKEKNTPMGVSHVSNPKSITISPLEEVIPVPTKIESKASPDEQNSNVIRETLSWGNISLDRYIKQMLDPLRISLKGGDKGTYEVYLHQNKAIKELDLTQMTTATAIILDTQQSYPLKREDIENLRKGKAVRLDYPGISTAGMNSILLSGLDANQVYYTTIRVRLDLKDEANKEMEKRYSIFSKDYSFTSYTKPSDPGTGERVPPVPEELTIIDQPNNTTATIGWKAPEYNRQEDEVLYYEMLRVDARVLAKEEESRLLTIEKLLGNNKASDIHAWRSKGPLVDQYSKTSQTWAQAEPQQASNKLQLQDDQLSPNKIYYYYVRTVLMVNGKEVYSSWVGAPVTTDPVQKPTRLKVENKDQYQHDPKTEIVISFLAPIPRGSNVPNDYDFDIAVQGELDDGYQLDYGLSRLTSKEDEKDIPTGYSHFVYKVQNLKPGKRYDIKVRTIDKLVDQVNNDHPKSLYSDRVSTRTHFDQEEQDKDDKFEAYLKYFEDKVEALRRKPYWVLEDGKTFSIKYRSDYIIPQINSSSSYNLAVKEGVGDFTYYMPASVIATSNINQTSFEIKQGDISYSIRPSTITSQLKELAGAIKDIEAKAIKDYYVLFNFRQDPLTSTQMAAGFLSPELVVDIELMTLKEEDLITEDDIILALNHEIHQEKAYYIEDLERALERGKLLDEELEVIVNRSMTSIENKHQKEVRRILTRNTRKVSQIGQWNKSLLIMATIEGNVVAKGYRLGWQDTELTTFNTGLGYGIEITIPGAYAFKGQKITMPVIPGVGGAGDLIRKYQLTDLFGQNGNINPSQLAIKKDVLGAMARVLGAPRGADYPQYLKQVGIQGVSNLGMNLPIKQGEGTYLVMQVYEKNLNKPIGSVYVKNRNIVANIQQFNRSHQPYVLVAVDSKIRSQGGGLRPNESMQVKDILEMLSNIMANTR